MRLALRFPLWPKHSRKPEWSNVSTNFVKKLSLQLQKNANRLAICHTKKITIKLTISFTGFYLMKKVLSKLTSAVGKKYFGLRGVTPLAFLKLSTCVLFSKPISAFGSYQRNCEKARWIWPMSVSPHVELPRFHIETSILDAPEIEEKSYSLENTSSYILST